MLLVSLAALVVQEGVDVTSELSARQVVNQFQELHGYDVGLYLQLVRGLQDGFPLQEFLSLFLRHRRIGDSSFGSLKLKQVNIAHRAITPAHFSHWECVKCCISFRTPISFSLCISI